MNLRDANFEVERLENKLNKLLSDKELLETMIDPKSTDYTKVVVDGGKHSNIIEIYILKKDLPRWHNIDKRIKITQEQIKNSLEWIDNEFLKTSTFPEPANKIKSVETKNKI